ncbi:hypothetical protein G5B30_15515 [Sphingobacterium sp. SGG-5]|uniref:hypothetical protein n=1 Tax=Sphingobacterium sp. SGG-5 TaxID=2710881 RepID=UPI0013EDDE1C|nr:hypothetical protein [Sphingobacterium sp. SGG-5]NGM63317.1 hypothetical protein [Sphingobacterium sp. SGG-5]
MNDYLKFILLLLLVSGIAFGGHHLVVAGMDSHSFWEETSYSLEGMYTFGFVSSLCVVVFILLAQWAMPKKVGLVFLGLMTIKAIASYIYIHNGLDVFEHDFIEYNFLVVFFVFLFFDVFVAFRIINEPERAD